MRVLKLVSVSVLAVLVGVTSHAKTLRNADEPAEFPPASYKGKQYVDSTGCVYVRAGYSGNVTWVPRVERSRKLVCGFKPTFASAPAAEPIQQVVVADPEPTRKTKRTQTVGQPMNTVALTKTPPKPMASAAQKQRRVQAARVLPAPVVAAPVANAAPESKVRKVATKKVVKRRVASAGSACANATGISAQYTNDGVQRPVRCGPQAESPYGTRVSNSAATAPVSTERVATTSRRTVQVVAVEPRVAPRAAASIPKGYVKVWKDDRLNPNRGGGTARGKAQMDLLWTETIPRRLIDATTGQDVTRQMAQLQYPYTNLRQQKKHLGRASTKNVVRTAKVKTRLSTKNVATTAKVRTRVSTKTVMPKAPAAAASHRYVQVGTFGVAANAKNTIARLQRMGLPVSVANIKKGGKPLQVVLAGPFSAQSQLNAALSAARKNGFKDAFPRR